MAKNSPIIEKISTNFRNNKIPKKCSQCICSSVILIIQITKYVIDDIEVSSDSDRENSDEGNSDERNSDEENLKNTTI